MKIKEQSKSEPVAEQPVFHKVAENLYRLESSGGNYALLKQGGKQFRRSLKTKDRKLAERRLAELRAKVGGLQISADAKLTFSGAATMWLDADRRGLNARTNLRGDLYVKDLHSSF